MKRSIGERCFKLATPHLKSSSNFHQSFCAIILMLKMCSLDRLMPPGPWIQVFPARRTSHILISDFFTGPYKNQGRKLVYS